ncbi:MAG: efflux RND transporter periplasmic adaptor subunit [Vicinamibacterales bacterium]
MTNRIHARALAATLLFSGALAACADAPKTTTDTQDPALAVEVARAVIADVADTFEAGGVVEARTTATIMSRILAPVVDVRVTPGDRVRMGQVLIVLDGRDLAAQVRRSTAITASADQDVLATTADRDAANAALALARATHERIAALHARRSATSQELDDATGGLRAAEARAAAAAARAQAAASAVDGARAGGEAAGTAETYSRLVAPFDGVVTEKMVERGNMAAPGTPLLRVEDTGGFRLDVRVDQSRLPQIASGGVVPVVIDAGPDGKTRTVSGTVTEVGRTVDSDARAFLVKITLPTDAGLRSGMFGRALFSEPARRALTVPSGAIVSRGQVRSVFVVEQDVARLRLVNVSGAEVLAGLSEGESVIVSPPPGLTDGRRVTQGGR